jgi:hypothetical protein
MLRMPMRAQLIFAVLFLVEDVMLFANAIHMSNSHLRGGALAGGAAYRRHPGVNPGALAWWRH